MIDVTPIEIRDYAISYGWLLVKEALRDGLFVLSSPAHNYKQLIFPIEPQTAEFNDMAELAVKKLADFSNKSIYQVIEEIREVNDDVISLRYYSDNKIINSLSFQEALESINATKQMILAAGSSVINPVLYHKRLSRAEAVDLLKQTRFRHTEEGSFILKVSCPVHLEIPPAPDLSNTDIVKPIGRRAFEFMNQASLKLVNTIEEDNFAELLEEQRNATHPVISYNFCDAIVDLFDDERELPFELRFQWSRSYTYKLPTLHIPAVVRFPYSFKSKLEELKNYFRPENRELIDTFFGTVENLNGDEGEDGKRSGEVILALIIDSEIVNARVNLSADYYEIAYKAHGQGGGLVKVKGKLLPGKRIRILDEITGFEFVEK